MILISGAFSLSVKVTITLPSSALSENSAKINTHFQLEVIELLVLLNNSNKDETAAKCHPSVYDERLRPFLILH